MSHPAPRRLVIDTNVVLDLWLFRDPATAPLRLALEAGRMRPLRTAATLAELQDVLQRPKLGLGVATRAELLERWCAGSEELQRVAAAPIECRDADDQKFLDAAFSGAAELLLTRDRALLELSRRAATLGLRIERPGAAVSYDARDANRGEMAFRTPIPPPAAGTP